MMSSYLNYHFVEEEILLPHSKEKKLFRLKMLVFLVLNFKFLLVSFLKTLMILGQSRIVRSGPKISRGLIIPVQLGAEVEDDCDQKFNPLITSRSVDVCKFIRHPFYVCYVITYIIIRIFTSRNSYLLLFQ